MDSQVDVIYSLELATEEGEEGLEDKHTQAQGRTGPPVFCFSGFSGSP